MRGTVTINLDDIEPLRRIILDRRETCEDVIAKLGQEEIRQREQQLAAVKNTPAWNFWNPFFNPKGDSFEIECLMKEQQLLVQDVDFINSRWNLIFTAQVCGASKIELDLEDFHRLTTWISRRQMAQLQINMKRDLI